MWDLPGLPCLYSLHCAAIYRYWWVVTRPRPRAHSAFARSASCCLQTAMSSVLGCALEAGGGTKVAPTGAMIVRWPLLGHLSNCGPLAFAAWHHARLLALKSPMSTVGPIKTFSSMLKQSYTCCLEAVGDIYTAPTSTPDVCTTMYWYMVFATCVTVLCGNSGCTHIATPPYPFPFWWTPGRDTCSDIIGVSSPGRNQVSVMAATWMPVGSIHSSTRGVFPLIPRTL